MSAKNNTNKLSDKLARLEAMVAWVESDEFDLDQALERYETAASLATEIEEELTTLKNTVTIIKKDFSRAE